MGGGHAKEMLTGPGPNRNKAEGDGQKLEDA
jgi:hypothetical protein